MHQDHLFPDDGGLALSNKCVVCRLCKGVQGLFKSFASRVQSSLSRFVRGIAVRIQLVATSTKERRRRELRCGHEQFRGEVGGRLRCKTELASRRLIRVGCPRGRLGASNVFGVRLGDDSRVSGRVDLEQDINAALCRDYERQVS